MGPTEKAVCEALTLHKDNAAGLVIAIVKLAQGIDDLRVAERGAQFDDLKTATLLHVLCLITKSDSQEEIREFCGAAKKIVKSTHKDQLESPFADL